MPKFLAPVDVVGPATASSFNDITGLNDDAENIKEDGTQSAGILNVVARADHVHPTDTSLVPIAELVSDDGDIVINGGYF